MGRGGSLRGRRGASWRRRKNPRRKGGPWVEEWEEESPAAEKDARVGRLGVRHLFPIVFTEDGRGQEKWLIH